MVEEVDIQEDGKLVDIEDELEPIQDEIPCTHGECIGYAHDGRILASCRMCGKTIDMCEWLQHRRTEIESKI